MGAGPPMLPGFGGGLLCCGGGIGATGPVDVPGPFFASGSGKSPKIAYHKHKTFSLKKYYLVRPPTVSSVCFQSD